MCKNCGTLVGRQSDVYAPPNISYGRYTFDKILREIGVPAKHIVKADTTKMEHAMKAFTVKMVKTYWKYTARESGDRPIDCKKREDFGNESEMSDDKPDALTRSERQALTCVGGPERN
jgi:hypothetical protein